MSTDLGVLVLRVVFGAVVAAHGAQKLFGSFGGYGLKGTGAFFETLGFKPGVFFAGMAGCSEFVGGLLLVLGLFTPEAAAVVLATMIVAMVSVHIKNGFFAMSNGIELPFLIAAAMLGIVFTGSGAYSLDSWFKLRLFVQPYMVVGGLTLAIVGAGLNLALRRRGPMKSAAV